MIKDKVPSDPGIWQRYFTRRHSARHIQQHLSLSNEFERHSKNGMRGMSTLKSLSNLNDVALVLLPAANRHEDCHKIDIDITCAQHKWL